MSVGWPRLERNGRGRPVWDQGPVGGIQVVLVQIPLPEVWPASWPEPPLSYEQAMRLLGQRP